MKEAFLGITWALTKFTHVLQFSNKLWCIFHNLFKEISLLLKLVYKRFYMRSTRNSFLTDASNFVGSAVTGTSVGDIKNPFLEKFRVRFLNSVS